MTNTTITQVASSADREAPTVQVMRMSERVGLDAKTSVTIEAIAQLLHEMARTNAGQTALWEEATPAARAIARRTAQIAVMSTNTVIEKVARAQVRLYNEPGEQAIRRYANELVKYAPKVVA
jgi:hypothetical protein